MFALKTKEKVLFLCKQNSVRSQIAETLLKSTHGEYYDVYSAGSNLTYVNPHAIIDRVVAFRRTRDEIREWIGKTFKM